MHTLVSFFMRLEIIAVDQLVVENQYCSAHIIKLLSICQRRPFP